MLQNPQILHLIKVYTSFIGKIDYTVSVTVDSYREFDGEREAELEIAASGIDPLVVTVYQEGPSSHLWHINPSVVLEGFDSSVKIQSCQRRR